VPTICTANDDDDDDLSAGRLTDWRQMNGKVNQNTAIIRNLEFDWDSVSSAPGGVSGVVLGDTISFIPVLWPFF